MEKAGFHRRRDPNFFLSSDPCLTAVGAPRALVRNYAGYSAIGKPRQGRWSAWEREGMAFDAASTVLQEREDICLPVEYLTELIQEDSKLNSSSRSFDQSDHLCGDLSWPGPCIENLAAGADAARASADPPLLVHAVGPSNADLALLRPGQWWSSNRSHIDPENAESARANSGDGNGGDEIPNGTTNGNSSRPRGRRSRRKKENINESRFSAGDNVERLALDSGRVRQISAAMPTPIYPPQVFARCDYSATLVELRGDLDLLRRQKNAVLSSTLADEFQDNYPGVLAGFRAHTSGLTAVEKLVFARRLTCAACSPYTRAHAAFLDEDFRLFTWHPNRGAVMHGPGPLQFPAPVLNKSSGSVRVEARARRARNTDVSLDYGHHPRVLWMVGQYKTYRVDLRESPSSATLTPALDPRTYFEFSKNPAVQESIVKGGSGAFGGRGEPPRVSALAVGRRSVHEVFVAMGLHLACMDDRFPKDAVARWDLPHEVDQLRWLPGLPSEGVDAEEIILASARSSTRYYVNTWAKDVPRWRGLQTRLGLDDTSPAASAARRPLTFGLPASTLAVGETRSGGLILALPPPKGQKAQTRNDGLCFIYATSTGDVYGQRLEVRRSGGEEIGTSKDEPAAVVLPHRSSLISDRIQSMLPCGDLCLDSATTGDAVVAENQEGKAAGTADRDIGIIEAVNRDGHSSSEEGNENDEDTSESVGSSGDMRESDGDRTARSGGLKRTARKRSRKETETDDDDDGNGGYREDGESAFSSAHLTQRREEACDTVVANGPDKTSRGVSRDPEYFPLNAGALRASLEVVPEGELCGCTRLPPLLKLVIEREAESRKKEAEGLENPVESVENADEQRRVGLARLQQRKDDVAKFLRQPRTPTELLVFCRNRLGIFLPGNPSRAPISPQKMTGNKTPDTPNAGGCSPSDIINDTIAAAAVAETVLRWGQPFRSIKTKWRVAPAPGAFVVADAAAAESSAPGTSRQAMTGHAEEDSVVLCSAQGMLKGKPRPSLAPGKFGAPFASDFSVQDVRWLKDQWK